MPAWIVPAAIAAGQLVAGLIGQNRQNKYEKRLAQYQADMNQKFIDAQNAYNSPQQQMARFTQAGLNPHLIYGQGNPGNQSQPNTYQQRSVDQTQALNSVLPNFQNAMLVQSQVQATNAKTVREGVLTRLNKLQADLVERNPLMNDAGFNAIINALKSSADIKASESGIRQSQRWVQDASSGHQVNKIFQEVKVLDQRFRLGELDAKLKAEVLQSKEFQNAILEVQKKWMQDADITPQHIYQFIQALLLKLF